MEKIGVIVGNGDFPLYFINEAEAQKEKNNISIYPIGLFESINEEIKNKENFVSYNIGDIGKIVKYLLVRDIKKIILLGKVEKKLVFENLKLDKYGKEILKMLPDKKDETLLFSLISFLKLNGIKVLPQSYLMNKFLFEEKNYTKTKPNTEDLKTIFLGMKAAKSLSKLDIGQTVIARDSSVIAIEGIEGTDETIKRAGKYSDKNNILIKMARPQQDMRVDIPVIGINTVKNAIENNFKGIVAESNKMLFLNKDECVKLADKNNFFIVGKKY